MRECTEEEANKVAIIQHTYRNDSVFECNKPRLRRTAHGRHYHQLGSKRLCTWAQCCCLIFALGCECWVDELELRVRVKCVPARRVVHSWTVCVCVCVPIHLRCMLSLTHDNSYVVKARERESEEQKQTRKILVTFAAVTES
jgi:hypothetical protein